MRHPLSTYRLQIRESFPLGTAAEVTGYLRDLGVSWAYLSPLLEATPGSDHGYDVVDVTRVDPARGSAEGLARFAEAARAEGLGILIDIVPNHMGMSEPRTNAWWWDVLRQGRASAHADAFDIDWEFGGGKVRVPVLGADLAEVIDEISYDPTPATDAPDGLVRYYDHVFPVAPGTGTSDIRALLDAQNFELRFWQDEAADLNYRRFFAVTTLAGVRVERPEVFDATHAEILRWVREGLADGLRVDHPDGLVDPGGYLDRLATALRDAGGEDAGYVLVEKILEHGEALPSWWRTAGTTGYDALAEIDRVLTDPAGEAALDALDARLRADSDLAPLTGWHDLIHDTKRRIADTIQVSEIRRIVRGLPSALRDEFAAADLQDALAEILACFPVYRSYLPAGRAHLDAAVGEAEERRPELGDVIEALVPALTDTDLEIAWRFQQTTGPVMAKGVEDTAFYRYTRLGSLTEVGGDPAEFSLDVDGFHAAQAQRQASWPTAMTTLSTHDTKRGEDTRARIAVLAEIPARWAEVLGEFRAIASTGHGPFDALLWQAIVGAWPASASTSSGLAEYRERLHAYAEKAAREASEVTGWWEQDEAFEERMHAVVDAATGPAASRVQAFVDEIADAGWSNGLAAKLLQITGPGVPDVYQGSELWEQSLVDPDNRRAVDFAERARLLASLDAEDAPPPKVDATGAAKLLVTSRALRVRRDCPERYALYRPLEAAGAASGHVVAFDRGGVSAVATRLPHGLRAAGGWRDTVLLRPDVAAVDVLTGRRFPGGPVLLSELLEFLPVALLVDEPACS
ncbi:malto-oligosyltrehalose synthase [Microbacterium sp. CSI-V]|uniref:malto-oligosyltrehalose synthase n=1 Tax=unclassified Microbacterium TaxID=2609290 RepID=UPI00097C867B|nr:MULTISPECIES: malto-oligosyltrehalose synthase [unclassified Microbacterium]MXS76271.1 malto-oligosyltrehalose synthase [Microbacterium sp. TL13]ONI64536.1 malto-oligosyltrehalose synthase [Microbacterium sp. CSI-V]